MVSNRKKEHIEKTLDFVKSQQLDPDFNWTLSDLRRMLERAFEAGVHAESDRAFAESNGFEMQPEPVAIMDVEPGSMLTLLLKEGE